MLKYLSLLIVIVMMVTGVMAQDDPETELVVFAAASLTDAFEEIAEAFTAENPHITVLFSFGGSSSLATQLLQGAPADVFASANERQMQVAVEGERVDEAAPVTFAENYLVLVVPADNPAEIESLDDLANEGVQLILAAPEVPVRTYTDAMLALMAEDAAYGENYVAAVLANLVSEEPNVRQVAAKIALGEADAGIIYLSDVTPDIAERVIAIPIPEALNTLAVYPIALVADSAAPEQAQAFIDFVLSEEGQAILEAWNFVPVLALEAEAEAEVTPEVDATEEAA
jgi:molybdate transport system substrate-binding protein